jgi:hypothetical protein
LYLFRVCLKNFILAEIAKLFLGIGNLDTGVPVLRDHRRLVGNEIFTVPLTAGAFKYIP